MSSAQFREGYSSLTGQERARRRSYYTEKLGFRLHFSDDPQDPRYAGVTRDGVRLHLQWHDPVDFREAVDTLMLRFVIDDVDALFAEYGDKGVVHDRTAVRNTSWGTREFAFYDADGNGLTFYRNL